MDNFSTYRGFFSQSIPPEFQNENYYGRTRPLILIADHASFHRSVAVRQFVRAHRTQIRLFFFPAHSPELNPNELVWNEIKHRRLDKQPIKTKADFRKNLTRH